MPSASMEIENDLREKAEAAVIKSVGIREFKIVLEKLIPLK